MNIVVQEVQIGRGALKVMVKDSIDIQGLKDHDREQSLDG